MAMMHFSSVVQGPQAAGAGLKLNGGTLETTQVTPTPASCTVALARDGSIVFAAQTEPADPPDEWFEDHSDATRGDDFEAQLIVNSGDAPTSGPSPGSFTAISTARTWILATSMVGTLTGNWNIEVREIAVPANTVNANFSVTSNEEVS